MRIAELHDFVDANCLGDTEALMEAMVPNEDGDYTEPLEEFDELVNATQELVDAWLLAGCAPPPEPAEPDDSNVW